MWNNIENFTTFTTVMGIRETGSSLIHAISVSTYEH